MQISPNNPQITASIGDSLITGGNYIHTIRLIKNIQHFERKSAASWLKKVFLNLLNFYSPNEAAIVFF